MIIAENQEELDKIACPSCGQYSLKMGTIMLSYPKQFTALCKNCAHKERGEGQPIKILSTEEHIKKHPEMYLGCDNSEWHKMAVEEIKRRAASAEHGEGR